MTVGLKVLHVTGALAPGLGGPSKAAMEMCEALVRKGLSVSLFTTDLGDRGRLMPFRQPARFSQLNSPARSFEITYFPARWPSIYAFSPAMWRMLAKRITEFDLVHIHSVYLFTTFAAARVASTARIPYVITPHGAFMPHLRRKNRKLKGVYHRFIGRSTWDGAAAIHYTSETERLQAQPLGIRAPSVVLPLGVNIGEFANLPPRGSFRIHLNEHRHSTLIVFLGRLAQRKGIDLLLNAFAQLAHKYPDSHLVLAGPDESDYEQNIRRSIHRLKLDSRVTLPGLVTGREKLALLRDTDIWVLPSYGENFGLAVVEALAAGCATVISDRVDIHQELKELAACEVVPPDAGLLARVLDRFLANESLRLEIGRRAKTVATAFSWERRIDRVIDLYKEISVANGHPSIDV